MDVQIWWEWSFAFGVQRRSNRWWLVLIGPLVIGVGFVG